MHRQCYTATLHRLAHEGSHFSLLKVTPSFNDGIAYRGSNSHSCATLGIFVKITKPGNRQLLFPSQFLYTVVLGIQVENKLIALKLFLLGINTTMELFLIIFCKYLAAMEAY